MKTTTILTMAVKVEIANRPSSLQIRLEKSLSSWRRRKKICGNSAYGVGKHSLRSVAVTKLKCLANFWKLVLNRGITPRLSRKMKLLPCALNVFEALGSDVDRTDSDSSRSDHEIPPQRKQYPEQTYMLQQPHRIKKKSNPYAVNMEIPQGRHVRGHGLGQNTLYQRQQMFAVHRAQQNLLQPDSFVNTRQYSPLNLTSALLRNDSSAFVPVKRGGSVASSVSSRSSSVNTTPSRGKVGGSPTATLQADVTQY